MSDIVRPICLVSVAFVILVVVNNVRFAVREDYVSQAGNAAGQIVCCRSLIGSVSKKETQVLRIVVGKRFLLLCQMKYSIRERRFSVIGDCIDIPQLRLGFSGFLWF